MSTIEKVSKSVVNLSSIKLVNDLAVRGHKRKVGEKVTILALRNHREHYFELKLSVAL